VHTSVAIHNKNDLAVWCYPFWCHPSGCAWRGCCVTPNTLRTVQSPKPAPRAPGLHIAATGRRSWL